jgi:signal transduction histidine kinase
MTEQKRQITHVILTIVSAAVCAFFSIPCAFIITALSASLFLLYGITLNARKKHVLKLCDDIDRILRNEEKILFDEYREDELSVLSAEVHKMTVRLREQNKALKNEKQFAKEALEDISHQLRTPLTSVMLILGLMRSPELSDKNRMEYLRELYELLDRMKWLIETMLNLSRIEADAVHFAKETVSCRELIERSLEPVAVTAELKNVELKVQITGDPVFTGDIRYTSEALINLLKNAVEHAPEGGTVTLSARDSNILTQITITDTGEGIPENELPHIFERFHRSSEYTKNGFGIGLAFAQKVIRSQEGSLKASNRRSGGAEFEINFYKTTV